MGYADSENGFTLFGERYYDSGTGRWLTRDPIGYAGGINVYAYCGNDPVDGADPWGLDGQWYDRLKQTVDAWVNRRKAANVKSLATNGAGVATATVLNTALDVAGGVLSMPSAIGHLGEGAGNFAALPSIKTAPGLVGDILTAASVLAPVGGMLRGGAGAPLTPDQQALISLAKEAAKRGRPGISRISRSEARTLLDWARELGINARGIEAYPLRPVGQYPHIHIGPVNHIWIEP
ncbi:MAG: RHS repeat-associated core domain-containing protein [Capsulimonadaceae bacterium]|nr:RHS repeat-associated core domain-containing protein [Capsulimonadaceae bacterium]